jgi:Winged helix DNA-binding domain
VPPPAERQLRLLRSSSQLLHRPRRRGAADLVRHLLAVQAQIPAAAGLALRARTEGLTTRKVDRARLGDRSIVLTWVNRGTLHLIAAEDYGWLVPLVVAPRASRSHYRLKQMGVSGDQAARGVRAIGRVLERDGPLTRPEIAERLRRLNIPTEGQIIAHLTWLAASEGTICYGPDRGRNRCFVLVRDWIGNPSGLDRDEALTELAVRYLRAHAPATVSDLAYWTGLRPTDARRAWASIEDRLTEVSTAAGPAWDLKRRRRDAAPPGLVRLLPSFDEYLLGWKDRRFIADAARWRRIQSGAGWFNPAVVADGAGVGTWVASRGSDRMRLDVRPFTRPASTLRRGLDAEARDLASYLGTDVEIGSA